MRCFHFSPDLLLSAGRFPGLVEQKNPQQDWRLQEIWKVRPRCGPRWETVAYPDPQGVLMEIYSIIENLEEDYDDNELVEALADVLMERQEKVNNSLLTQKTGLLF